MIDGRGDIDPAIFQMHGTDVAAGLDAHEHLAAAKIDRARREDGTEADATGAGHSPRHPGVFIERAPGETVGHDARCRTERPRSPIA